MKPDPIVIVGAGIAGLSAAVRLAAAGFAVRVFERCDRAGGKIRSCDRQDMDIDVGPTVFTMPWVFDELLAPAGVRLSDRIAIEPLDVLAHHRWPTGAALDLHADRHASAAAIAEFAGQAAAADYLRFEERAKKTYQALLQTFMLRPQPGFLGLAKNAGASDLAAMAAAQPFSSLWNVLGRFFSDQRLRQLFGRYATYYGSSPFAAPATLMLIAYVEQLGVWRVRGGLTALTGALATVAEELGAEINFDCAVARINLNGQRAEGVELANGERLAASGVVVNADVNALAAGFLGDDVRNAVAAIPESQRSLSAITWAGRAACATRLQCHNVAFSDDYRKEFDELGGERGVARQPTVYVHAPDSARTEPGNAQRLFLLINAAARGDRQPLSEAQRREAQRSVEQQLAGCGMGLDTELSEFEITTPSDFARRYPATGGALYGRATHHWTTPFRRPSSRTRVAGLYVAGGSAHPGAGVPMAALSGQLAADCVTADAP